MDMNLSLADPEAADGDEEAFAEIEEELSEHDAIEVAIPEGLSEGNVFVAIVGDEEFEITVPPGYSAGDILEVTVPLELLREEETPEVSGKKARLKPKRSVSFTEEEPSVMLFSPEVGGLTLEPEPMELIDFVIPENVVPGDILEVQSNSGEMIEVVVPDGAEVGMTLSIECPVSPSPRDRELEELGFDTKDLVEQLSSDAAEAEDGLLELETLLAEEAALDPTEPREDGKPRSPKSSKESLMIDDVEATQGPVNETSEPESTGSKLEHASEAKADEAEATSEVCEESVAMGSEEIVQGFEAAEKSEVLEQGEAAERPEEDGKVISEAEMTDALLSDSTYMLESVTEQLQSSPEISPRPEMMSQKVQTEASDVQMRRWAEAPRRENQVEVSVQTEAAPEELTLIPEAMKAGVAPPLPSLPGDLPSCSVQCRIPLFEDMGSSVTLTALKLAVETLQREKEELQQKLRVAQKEILRLELRDEDEVKSLRAEQASELRRENDELRKIALAALRQSEGREQEVTRKVSNKIRRIEAEAAKENKWLTPKVKAKAEANPEQVALEDLEERPEASRLPSGPAGGSHGVRRIRRQSDSCVATFKVWQAKPRFEHPDVAESPSSVRSSPCGSSKEKVVRLKPRRSSNRFAAETGSSRSAESRSTWREKSARPSSAEARAATASIYSAAALAADSAGWGATATAAEAVARTRDSKGLQAATVQPLVDEVKVAPVCERAVNGAFVLEPGQEEPDLQCIDEISEGAKAQELLAKEDMELKDFFIGGAFLGGSCLSDCCPSYTLVDDGSACGAAESVPLFRHVSGCLLLGFPVNLVAPTVEEQDVRLYFCRGPLPVMRRFARGVLGCMELLFELFADGKAGSEFYVLHEGPGYENAGETGGSFESLCYLPILVDKRHSQPCAPNALKERDQRPRSFIKLPDIVASTGFAFQSMERRLEAEVYHSDQSGTTVRLLAHFLSSLGRAEEAASHWQKALEEDEEKHGSSLQSAVSAAGLAACLDDLGRAEEAEPFHAKALAAMAKKLGRGSAETVACELSLAACRHVQGKCKLSGLLPSTQSGLLCLEGAPAQAVTVIFSQAVGHEDAGEAEALYRQALGILRRTLGQNHPDTLHCLNNLALCMADQGKLKEAEQLLRRTVAGMEVVLAPTHPRPIQALSNLACCLAEQGQTEEAESYHRRAFENCKRRLGWQHPETSACAQSLAQFLTSCGRCTEAALLELQADQLARPCWQRGGTPSH